MKPRKTDKTQRIFKGFGAPKEIIPVTRELRTRLAAELSAVEPLVVKCTRNYQGIPAAIKLNLHPKGIAKSNRPTTLLSRVDMLPIGSGKIGEMILPATKQSLDALQRIIKTTESKSMRAEISAIDTFREYSQDDVLRINPDWNAKRKAQSVHDLAAAIDNGKPIIIERFTSDDETTDAIIIQQLSALLRQINPNYAETILHATSGATQVVRLPNIEAALNLTSFPGLRSLFVAEDVAPIEINPQAFAAIGKAPPGTLPVPSDNLPIVGVIDSGVKKTDPLLTPWIVARETYVIPPETDHLHGTFVSGLIAGACRLNNNDPRFPLSTARIVDVAAIAAGAGKTDIDELLAAIAESVEKHPEAKVWNCSFGTTAPGHPDFFGPIAQELDAIADAHGVLFVIAAGNTGPDVELRQWPEPQELAGLDRISQPAESVRGLTVASIAHADALVKAGHPSPFSRRGPGPAKTPKPDLTHRGGNCEANGQFRGVGVRSLLPGGVIGESIGTSFSTPLVSAVAANAWHVLERKGIVPRPEMVKALLIHAAVLRSPARKANDRNYYGFGVPESVTDLLFCDPASFTLMFDAEVSDGINWEKTPYPIPDCLHPNGTHFRGEVIMTVVYAPPVDGKHGSEYVRANITASFGSYDPDDDGVLHQHALAPMDAPKKTDLYEEALIENSFKWSPVKVYRGRYPSGKQGENFRLYLELLRRSGELPSPEPLRAVVLVTLRGLEPQLPVYQDGIKALKARQWQTESVSTKTQIRV